MTGIPSKDTPALESALTVEYAKHSGRWIIMETFPSGYRLATHWIFIDKGEAEAFLDSLSAEEDLPKPTTVT